MRSDLPLRRRDVIKLLLASSTGAVLAACTSPAPAAPPSGASATSASVPNSQPTQPVAATPAASAPKTGGTLRVGIIGDLQTLDGHWSSPTGNSTVWQIYDPLISYDDNLQPQGELAESWELSSDARQLKLNLRKGVQFHTGREFTSDDVRYNLQRLRDPKNLATTAKLAPQAAGWDITDTPDKYTVILGADKSRPGIFDFLLYFNMLDRDTMEGPNAKTKAVGTGPFTFVEYAQGDRLRLAKNTNYWKSGAPLLDGIDVTILNDPQSMIAQLEAGALDLADSPPLRDAARLKQDPKYSVLLDSNRGWFYYVVVNTTVKPLDNKQVRQALNYAINRQRFTDSGLLNLAGGPQDLPWASRSPAYDAAKSGLFAYDLDKAKSLLSSAGVSDLPLAITYTPSNEAASFAQIYQADLASIGVKATIAQVETAVYNDQVAKLTFQGVIFNLGSQAHLYEAATGIAGTRSFNPDNGSSGFKDPKYADLITSAATEPDATKRKQIYSDFNDYVLDQSFTMPVSWAAGGAATASKVHGLRLDMIPRYVLREVWLE